MTTRFEKKCLSVLVVGEGDGEPKGVATGRRIT